MVMAKRSTLSTRLFSILLSGLLVIIFGVSATLTTLDKQKADNSYVSKTLRLERGLDHLQRLAITQYNENLIADLEEVNALKSNLETYSTAILEQKKFRENQQIISNLENLDYHMLNIEKIVMTIQDETLDKETFKELTNEAIEMVNLLEDNKALFIIDVRKTTKQLSQRVSILGSMLALFMIVIYGSILRYVIIPLRKISKTINAHSEDYKMVEIDYESETELGTLVRGYNERVAQFNTLQQINIKVNTFVEFHEVIEYVYHHFKRFVPYNRIGVSVITDNGQKVRAVELMTDGKVELGDNYVIDIDETSLGKLAKERRVRIINDLEAYYEEHPTSQSTETILKEGIRSSLTVPLYVREDCIGFLFLSSVEKQVYNESHVGFLRIVADHLAIAIENSFRHEDLILSTINGFAKLVESRDADTGDHVDRMKSYCDLIARLAYENELFRGEVDEKTLFTVSRYSQLHDIGKIGIPDDILLKPAKLTADEFEVIKTHPLIGAEILEEMSVSASKSNNNIFKGATEIVKYHHEKYDGSGYPDGLKGKSIPIVARIVAVGDVLDALSSKRVYKDKFGFDESFRILEEGRGKHFDPDLIDLVIANKDKFFQLYAQFYSNA
jgi:HD-GYP domain-containing protein (c-di-GMP phosphodiesterase class II)